MNDLEYYKSKKAREDAYQYLLTKHVDCTKLLNDVPKVLYKYSSLNKFTVYNITRERLTASMPALFNDPYDSFFKTQIHTNIENENSKFLSDEKAKELNEQIRANDLKRSIGYQSFSQKNSYVLSLSESGLNGLLWSHYADSGRGICVEYDIENSNMKDFVYPVIYSKNVVDFSDLGDPYNYNERAPMVSLTCELCKGLEWSYEDEWRAILLVSMIDNGEPRIEWIAPKIKSITLGPSFIGYWVQKHEKMDTKSNDEIMRQFIPFCKWVKEHNVTLHVASINREKFKYNNSEIINADTLITLNESLLDKYYDLNLLGYY